MTTRSRIIEGTWNCTSCDTKGILGRHKKCPTCNNPREATGQESKFDFGGTTASGASTQASVTDDKALSAAKAGADWFCVYCAASNRGDATKCKNCSAVRPEGQVVAAQQAQLQQQNAPPPKPLFPPVPKSSHTWMYVAIAGGVVLVGGITGFGYWATRTSDVTGKVKNMNWSRQVHRELFTPVVKQSWRDQIQPAAPVMPVNGRGERAGSADVRGCARKQRGTKQVPDGTHTVCRTKTRQVQCGSTERCTTRDLGNGFAEEVCNDVPKYCSESYEDCRQETRYRTEPVFGDWCSFSTFEWQRVDTARAAGDDAQPAWPQVSPGKLERTVREEQYAVTIAYQRKGQGQVHQLKPKSEAEYARWRPGQGVKVTVSNLGGVTAVAPAP